jgi:hypothetical protein
MSIYSEGGAEASAQEFEIRKMEIEPKPCPQIRNA